jgi:ribosomal protein L11 methyltransferase
MPFILTLSCSLGEKDLLAAELDDSAMLGLIEEDQPGGRSLLRAFFDDSAQAAAIAQRLSGYCPVIGPYEAQDWVTMALSQWKPVLVGERFFLAPAWCDDPAPAGRLRMSMPPGTASGTGLHASTQLMLAALERELQPGDTLLDLGTGSGILSAAALLLGAGTVFACDIENDAVLAAREYTARRVPLFLGSARSLRDASVDVVAANINAATLMTLTPEIARVLTPGGRALLGGFTTVDLPRLLKPIEAATLAVTNRVEQNEWILLTAGTPSGRDQASVRRMVSR